MKPLHECNYPACGRLIPYDQRYCSKHQYHKPIDYADSKERHRINAAVYHRRITSKHEAKYQRFYRSTQWKHLSHHWLMLHPFCADCMKRGIYRKGDVVDHIVEIRDDWTRRLDDNNLQTLCYACHNAKTARERAKRYERQQKQKH